MINLVSNSITRAEILRNAGIEFNQISFDFDETLVAKTNPLSYSYQVANLKKEQFLAKNEALPNLLFADSSVICGGEIFGKAKNDDEAYAMLKAQSGTKVSVATAMIFLSSQKSLINLSFTTYEFDKFDEADLRDYIASKDYVGKAGAMMIEGFNKKYILSQIGHTSTARGLNVEILKAFL